MRRFHTRGDIRPEETSERLYRAREFAERAGVTVRTLHHYDRLGLLRPSGRTEAGYRLYSERDLARLEQIVALKFIGFPLKQIKDLLDRSKLDLKTTLRFQREIIEEKRRHLDRAIQAIARAERMMDCGEPDWEAFKKIIEVINMHKDMEWTKKYYSEEAREELARRNTPREVIEKGEREWAILIKDVEAALAKGEDPASKKAQALVERWSKLLQAFTGGSRAIQEGLNKLYADQANWPSTFKKPYSDEVGEFICKAMAMRKKG